MQQNTGLERGFLNPKLLFNFNITPSMLNQYFIKWRTHKKFDRPFHLCHPFGSLHCIMKKCRFAIKMNNLVIKADSKYVFSIKHKEQYE